MGETNRQAAGTTAHNASTGKAEERECLRQRTPSPFLRFPASATSRSQVAILVELKAASMGRELRKRRYNSRQKPATPQASSHFRVPRIESPCATSRFSET